MKKRFVVLLLFIAVAMNVFALSSHKKPSVALVLSGGGAKGYVHIATIKMIEKYGIPVDYVVGTSMGAIVGGLYAAGYTSDEMLKVVNDMNITDAVFSINPHSSTITLDNEIKTNDFSIGFDKNGITSLTGIVDDTKILNTLNHLFARVNAIDDFDKLPRSFRAIAADITTGETVALGTGHITEAVRSSMSIPLVFPVFYANGHYLVDGGVKENLPLDTAIEEFHPDIIITSDCTGSRYRKEAKNDLKSRLDEGTSGIDSVFSSSLMISNASKYDATDIDKLSDIMVEYDTTAFGTASFSKANAIIESAMVKVEEYDEAFATLSARIKENRVDGEMKNYNAFALPYISSLKISAKERYRHNISDTLYNYFKKFTNRVLDENTLYELESEILKREYFFGASLMYYVLNDMGDGTVELEIISDFPPQRQHNLFTLGEIKFSMQMTPHTDPNDTTGYDFGFSFFPDTEIGYKYLLSPESSMDSISVKFQSAALFKENRLSFAYTHIMESGKPYVLLLSPRVSFYAGISAPESLLSITNYFGYYDYGVDTALSFAYANRLHTLLLNVGLDYKHFGIEHFLLGWQERENMLLPYVSLDFVLGRTAYYSLPVDTDYRLEIKGKMGFDLGSDVLNSTFLKTTSYPFRVEAKAEGSYKVHNNVILGLDGSLGISRWGSDLFEGLFAYGEAKGMPGFSISDRMFDYYMAGFSISFPFGQTTAFTPLFSLRLAVGAHDIYELGDINDTPYSVFNDSYTPFSKMSGINLGLGGYFGFHTPFLDFMLGVGYEFFEKKFSINIELW